MKRRLLLMAVAAAAVTVGGQINEPGTAGDLARGEAMFADRNYVGCIDQLTSVDRGGLSRAELEHVDWLLALSAVHTSGGETAVAHLRAFVLNYPASLQRNRARLLMGNCLAASDVDAALEAYEAVSPEALDADDRASLAYHRAYCLLMKGDTEAAGRGFAEAARNAQWRNNSLFYQGYIAYAGHDYAAAREYLSRVDRSTMPGSDADYYLAQIAYVEGDYGRAADYASALLARRGAPSAYRAEACRIAGESAYQQGQSAEAIKYLKQYAALAESPAPSALYLLGTTEYKQGDYRAAVRTLEGVSACDDAMGQSASLFIGEALMRLGDKDAAILAFDRAARADYDPAVQEAALYNRAVAAFGGANVPFGSSAAAFEEFLAKFPEGRYAGAVQEYLVARYLNDNNYEAALASVERMRNPGDKVLGAKQQILYALGSRALATGETGAAADYLGRARQLDRYSREVASQTALALGETYYRQGDYGRAAELINEYLRTAPASDANRKLARYDLGYALFAQKDYAGARQPFADAADSRGALSADIEADALNRLADTYYYTGEWANAAKYYGEAYDRNPGSGDYAKFQQAVMLGYQRDHKGKIAALQRMMNEFPTSSLVPAALLEMTESQQQLGNTSAALDTYGRIISLYPGTVQARRASVQMAMTLLNTGRRAEAVKVYRQLIADAPTSDEALVAADELKRLAAEDGTLGEFGAFLAGIDNAPQLDVAQADELAFDAAERAWLADRSTRLLESYVAEYPRGAHRATALAYLMESAAEPSTVVQYADELIEGYPDSRYVEQALLAKGESLAALARPEEALQALRTLEQRASTPLMLNSARAGIMRIARGLGDAPLMLTAADALLASSTTGAEDRAEATFTRGLALDMQGQAAEARDVWATIAGETNNINGVKSAYYRAESLHGAGQDAEARRAVEAIIDSATPHTYWLARAFILLSDIYAAEGKTYEAREYLRSLRDNYPGDESDIMQMIDTRLNQLK